VAPEWERLRGVAAGMAEWLADQAAIAEIGRFIEDSGPFIRGQLKATAS
jgi:hypothetical protein